MTGVWILTAVLFLGTVLFKLAGPLALGDRRPAERGLAVIRLVAPAVLTALIIYGSFADTPQGITLDERAIGLAAAATALAARAPMVAVIVIAAAATAVGRMILS
jgi:hypothetical protein